MHQDHVEFTGEEGSATELRLAAICWVVLKEGPLSIERRLDRLVMVNIPLASIHHRYISQSQGNTIQVNCKSSINRCMKGLTLCRRECPQRLRNCEESLESIRHRS